MADEKKVSGKTRAGGAAKPFPWEEAIAEQYERTKSRLKGLATEPEAELQRILEQYLPKKSDSREERLQKLEDLAMGFAGTTKLPTPKLARASEVFGPHEGKTAMFTETDRTKVGGGFLGGPGFSSLQLELPAYEGKTWGVASMPKAQTIIRSNQRVPEGQAIWSTYIGHPEQHRSNQMVFDQIFNQFRREAKKGNLPNELRESINERLATQLDANNNPLFPPDVDIMAKNFRQLANTFDRRAAAAEIMGGKGVGGKKGSIVDYPKLIESTTDPALVGAPTWAVGPRVFTLTGDVGVHPELHPAFPYLLHGEDLGKAFNPVPHELAMKDFIEKVRREKGRKMGYMDLARGYAPQQFISEEWLTALQKAGYAEGGLAQYGLRHSGEGVKGKGYFGPMAGRDGTVTELSAEDDSGEFPLVVPTLTAEEIDRLLAGGEPTPEMLDKASSWAATRRKRGESPFASPTELRMPRPKAEGGGVYSPRPGLVFVGQEHGAPADVPQEIRDLANQVGAFYEGSGGDKLPDIRYRGSWDDAASRSVKGYPPEYLYTIFTNTDVNRQKDALVGEGTIFNNLLKNQQQVGYFKDRRFNRKDLTNFLQSMGPEFLRDSQNPATESNVEDFLRRGEQLMWESGDTPARQLANKANESRQRWLLNQPKGVFFMGSDHLQKLKELHGAGKKAPVKKADGGAITDLPDEVNPSNWREHLQNNVLADARALLGAKDGGVINLDELIEKSLKKKDGGVINLDELIAWTLAKDEHRKMKEGGAVKMQGGGNPGEVAGDMFKPKPLSIPEPITSLVEALRRQFEKEKRSMRKPGAAQDVLLRGPVAAYAGAPADILGMGGELLDYAQKKIPALRKPASVMDTGPEKTPPMGYAPVFPLSPEGSYGTTAAQEMMGKAGLTTGEERPLFETGAMVGAPVAGYAGLKAGKALAPTATEMLDVQLQKMMSPYQMNVIKPEGGNWVRGSTDKFLSGLRYDDEVDRLRIYTPEARAEEQARVDAYNNFIDKKLKRYMENQLGTPSDPVRIQADAWAETQKTLLAEKEKQISKVRSDIEKARRERNVDPEVLTRSQARLRQLQNEKDLIKNRKGLHFTPVTGDNSFAALEAASRRSQFGAPRERVAQSEIGKRWEDRADLSIYQQPYMDQPQIGIAKNYAEIKNAAEGTNIVDKAILDEVNKELEKMGGKYALENPEALAYRTSGGLDNLGFQHLADELDNALNPSMGLPEYLQLTPKTLDKMSVAQVVEHVDKINAWRASQKAEVDKARAANAATVVHKEYPEQGLKWVELKMPDVGEVVPEGWSAPVAKGNALQTKSVNGDVVLGESLPELIKNIYKRHPETPGNPRAALEDALKYEGEILQHCVGGYCPDVVEGRSRIFSLRDEDGRPHATIEVEPEARIGFRQGEGPKTPDEDYALRNQYVAGVNDGSISNDMTFAEWWRSKNNIPEPERRERISQIKGLQNKKPEAEFMPYIQDFVKGGDWSHVGDISHTDLTPAEALRAAGWDLSKINQKYLTKEEIEALKSQSGMKRGGRITKADLEREYRMAFGGGVFNTDPDITDAGRIIPEHTI